MRELQDLKGVGFMDVQFLLNAVTTVISCRYVLQWTYAYDPPPPFFLLFFFVAV